jgi:hypothetical protein
MNDDSAGLAVNNHAGEDSTGILDPTVRDRRQAQCPIEWSMIISGKLGRWQKALGIGTAS